MKRYTIKWDCLIMFMAYLLLLVCFAVLFWAIVTYPDDNSGSHHIEGVVVYEGGSCIVVQENATGELYSIFPFYWRVTLDVGDAFNATVDWEHMTRVRP